MNQLKEIRKLHGKKQQDLANFLNVTHKAISFYELGQRDIPNASLIKLAEHLNVSIDEILGYKPIQVKDKEAIQILDMYLTLPPDKKVCAREYIYFLSNTCQNKQPIQQDK